MVRNGHSINWCKENAMFDVDAEIRDIPPNFPGLGTLDPVVVYLMGCMKFDQFCCTWRSLTEREKFCPFCPAELTRRGRKPIHRTDKWMLLENEFPRDDVEHMLLLVPTLHMISSGGLDASDWTDIGALFHSFLETFVYPAGALVMRHGDPRSNAGTIEHLHINLIKPTREGGMSVPLAKTVEGHRADYARLHDFVRQIHERGGMKWLFSKVGIEETQPPVM